MQEYMVTRKTIIYFGAVVKANSAAEAKRYADQHVDEESSEQGISDTKWKAQPVIREFSEAEMAIRNQPIDGVTLSADGRESLPYDADYLRRQQHDSTAEWYQEEERKGRSNGYYSRNS